MCEVIQMTIPYIPTAAAQPTYPWYQFQPVPVKITWNPPGNACNPVTVWTVQYV